jgi:hypothetical protein
LKPVQGKVAEPRHEYQFLLGIQEIQGLNPGPAAGYPERKSSWLSSVPLAIFRDFK